MRLIRVAAAFLFASALGWSVGCGNDSVGRQPVAGSVNVNGKPVEKGTISFQPVEKGTPAGGRISGGKFSIARKDGPPAGKYRISINAPVPGTGAEAPAGAMPGEPLPPPQELIPPEWNTSSEHFVEVTKGKNEFTFDVQAKQK